MSLMQGLYGDPLAELEVQDRALLKTPESASTPVRQHSHVAVPFLRRTEYIAAEKHSTPPSATGNILRGTRRPSLKVAQQELDHVFEDPEVQIRMTEQMFKDVDRDWINAEHPRKRGVKCVDSWELLPDRSRIGQAFLLMRFQDDHISIYKVRSPVMWLNTRMILLWKSDCWNPKKCLILALNMSSQPISPRHPCSQPRSKTISRLER